MNKRKQILFRKERGSGPKITARIFFWMFLASCLLFWWLPSIIYRFIIFTPDPVNNRIIEISFFSWLCFASTFLFTHPKSTPKFKLSNRSLDLIQNISKKITIYLFFPSLIFSIKFFAYRSDIDYGLGVGLPSIYQAILYVHLFFGFMYLGTVNEFSEKKKKIFSIALLIIIPRFIVSLYWGRFFLAQAIIPIVLIYFSRGWVSLNFKRIIFLCALSLVIIFIPSVVRGDFAFGHQNLVQFFANGSTLKLFQDNLTYSLTGRCNPLLVSLTAKTIPYNELHICTIDIWGEHGLPATLDRLLAFQEIGYSDSLLGPGSNYLLELYLSGGFLLLIVGSLVLGMTCKFFIYFSSYRSIFTGIWVECLTRALFAPRSNIGYIYERVPSLLLASLLLLLMVQIFRAILKRDIFKFPIKSV